MKEALLYETLSDGQVRCHLCAHECLIPDEERGICRARENHGGTLYTLVYGRTIARNIDPIEKKPLFHFYPGTIIYSIATPGCNFSCQWCQNADISQLPRQTEGSLAETGQVLSPAQVVESAQQTRCRGIAYTYTEPTIFFEYAYDTAQLAHEADLANVYVTNGYMTGEMIESLAPYLDAANVDLKAFRDQTYREYMGARLQPVLDSMIKIKQLGIWLEVTTLILPGINDDPDEIKEIASFIVHELGEETPWHINRFFPAHQMTQVPPTPLPTLRQALEIGYEQGLHHVYLGNVPDEEDTLCQSCGRTLIRRSNYRVLYNQVEPDGRCPYCKAPLDGVGMGS